MVCQSQMFQIWFKIVSKVNSLYLDMPLRPSQNFDVQRSTKLQSHLPLVDNYSYGIVVRRQILLRQVTIHQGL